MKSPLVGSEIYIIDGGSGARGASCEKATVVNPSTVHHHGAFNGSIKVQLSKDDSLWALNEHDCKLEILSIPKTKKNSVVLTVSGWNNSETHIVLDPDKRFVAVTTVENYLDHFGLENATATFDKQYLGDLIQKLTEIHNIMED